MPQSFVRHRGMLCALRVGCPWREMHERHGKWNSVVSDTETVRLHDLVYRGGWTMLAFTGRRLRAEASAALKAVNACARSGLDEEAHRVYAIDRSTLLLVRPDGHVAVRVRPAHVERLQGFLDKWVPDPSQAFVTSRAGIDSVPVRAA